MFDDPELVKRREEKMNQRHERDLKSWEEIAEKKKDEEEKKKKEEEEKNKEEKLQDLKMKEAGYRRLGGD